MSGFTAPTKMNPIEMYFTWYCNELKEQGFIKEYRREAFSIELAPRQLANKISFKKKTSIEVEQYTLLNRVTYKFDYIIVWEDKAEEYFFNILDDQKPYRIWCPFYAQKDKDGKMISLCDVKPPAAAGQFGNNTSYYTFPIVQKVIWHFYAVWVNKAIPIPMVRQGEVKSGNESSLFTTTFVPKRYMLSDGGGQARDIKYRFNSLQQYIQKRGLDITTINARMNIQGKLNF